MRKSSPSGARPTGFTLVELLVVIGIIALLISMLLPALNKARTASKVTVCASNQRQIYLAVSMYANDNRGNLPGTNADERTRGADLFQSYGVYPWEIRAGALWYNGGDRELPPGVTYGAGGDVRWFGIGQLVNLKYLTPSSVLACPDFECGDVVNFAANNSFRFTDAYYKYNGQPDLIWANTGATQTSYVLNTLPYYAKEASNPANGKLGKPGQSGGRWSTGMLLEIPHHRALIMCLTTYGTGVGANPPSAAHGRKGVNVTYIDGHVVFQPIDKSTETLLNSEWSNSSGDDLTGYWNSFWCWATKVE